MAVISHGLGGCRAEQERQSQEVWEGAMPEPPATISLCPHWVLHSQAVPVVFSPWTPGTEDTVGHGQGHP